MKIKTAFIIPDLHFPFQDKRAVKLVLKAHSIIEPDITLIGGDLLDCSNMGRFEKQSIDQFQTLLQSELSPAVAFLTKLNAKKLVYLQGNHEFRIERLIYNTDKLDKLHDLITLPADYIKQHIPNVTVVPYCSNKVSAYHLSPNLIVVHGFAESKQAATKHLELARNKSIIFNHTHRGQMDTARNWSNNTTTVAISAGCLCDVQPEYLQGSPSNWTQGFLIAYYTDKIHNLYPVIINKGKCILPSGQLIKC